MRQFSKSRQISHFRRLGYLIPIDPITYESNYIHQSHYNYHDHYNLITIIYKKQSI